MKNKFLQNKEYLADFFYGIQITDRNIPHSSQMKESKNQRQPVFLAVSITKHALAIYCPFLLAHHKNNLTTEPQFHSHGRSFDWEPANDGSSGLLVHGCDVTAHAD